MGLDTTHNAWHGSYMRFSKWRNEVAEIAGYSIVPFGRYRIPQPLLDWGKYTESNSMGEWAETPADPLIVLLVHSDCDGLIMPQQALPLADALEALLPRMEGWTRVRTIQFILGLRLAVELDEPVEFM